MAKKIKFQLPLKNKGTIDLTNAVTDITVPAGVSFIKATPTVGTYDSNLDIWTVPVLPVGDTYHLYAEWKVDDEAQAPFTFEVATVTDQQSDEETPVDNTDTRIYTLDDLFPCPNCPPPSMSLTDTTWYSVQGYVDFEGCTDCTTELTLVASSEVNIDTVTIDSETGFYTAVLTDRTQPWEFQVEGNCINCPYWCGTGNDYGPWGPITVSGEGSCCDSGAQFQSPEFLDLQSGDFVTLTPKNSTVMRVYRNGRRKSSTEYTYDGVDKITFTVPFSIGEGSYGEDVIVDIKI